MALTDIFAEYPERTVNIEAKPSENVVILRTGEIATIKAGVNVRNSASGRAIGYLNAGDVVMPDWEEVIGDDGRMWTYVYVRQSTSSTAKNGYIPSSYLKW